MLIIIFLFFLIASWVVSSQLKSRFKKYSKTPLDSNLSGKEVAEKMLHDNGIYDVKVLPSRGQLSDHYNPANKTVNLSENVYHGRNVAAAAVAAHECGHAVQHAHSYAPLKLRSALVPVQNVSAKILNAVFIMMFMGAFLLPGFISFDLALQIIIACYAVFTLFAFITLPVEINATNRALAWLHSANITTGRNHNQAQDALKWAAYTYVVAALSALATLAYYLMIFLGRRD
ncbi:zinc metallopeptidase [Anaerophaga thermohalophila]|uniref:zinc metallopeptidase n=1 Tax=Anaerophaga thermohalophila TaxID=177400 RepID=UPI000237C47F|nr:zinc metallopeptidase [Anaerophaga thermohalophila]